MAILRLGEFDALLTGDIGPREIDEVLATGLVKDVNDSKINQKIWNRALALMGAVLVGAMAWGKTGGN